MKFKRGNKVVYCQDFHVRQGLPHDVEFNVRAWLRGWELRANGHGGQLYGNGSIYVPSRLTSSSVKQRLRAAAEAAEEK